MIEAIVVCLLALLGHAKGRPNGAPTCVGDESAPGVAHRAAGFFEGTIAQGNLTIAIDGQPLVTGDPVDLVTDQVYEVVVETPAFFRGVLARISGGDAEVDTTPVFQLFEGETDLKISDACDDLGVSVHMIVWYRHCIDFLSHTHMNAALGHRLEA